MSRTSMGYESGPPRRLFSGANIKTEVLSGHRVDGAAAAFIDGKLCINRR